MTILSSRGSGGLETTRDWCVPMPTPSVDPQKSNYELQPINQNNNSVVKASWRSLFAFTTRRHTASIVFAALATIGAGILKPISAIFYGNIFSALAKFGAGALNGQETLQQISKWCIALVAVGGGAWLFEGALLSTWMIFGELQAKSVREQMFTGMLEKDMEWYDLREDGIGSLLIRIQTQVRELQLAVSQPLGFLLFEVVGSIVALGTAFYFSWKLTLVIIAAFPVAAVVLCIISIRLGPAIEAQKRELSRASKYANTAITAIDTVKAFNGQDHEVWQYYSTIKKAAGNYLVQARANALQFGVTKFTMVAIFVLGFWYGIVLANKGLDPGRVVTTFYACLNAMQAVEIVLPQWLVLTKGMSAGETLKSIRDQLKHGRTITYKDGSVKPAFCPGDIEINGVSFAYPSNPRQSALSSTNFFFPSGETTFIVGKSGSGKSTLGNLLMKYYEPLWGEMLIDGQSIQTLDSEWLRENITLVQQQTVVFNETLRQNIEFGTRNCFTEGDIKAACKIAGLDQIISELPEGLDTVVGSNGRALSGGQQQRVAIARARLRDAPILILDEATSALDQTSRMEVMDAIRKWRKGRTTIIITHDISQILEDDYVYVLEYGMVVQEGYCKVLAQKTHGTFSTFRPASQVVDEKPTEPRRKSEPPSPSYSQSSFDEDEFPQRWGYISKIFGMQEGTSNAVSKSMNIQGSNRMSLGVAAIQANALRADNIWSSPVIPEAEFSLPQISRTPPMPFISPRLPPQKPHSALMPFPLRTSSLAYTAADTNPESSTIANVRHTRPAPPPIDTTISHPGTLITKAQLTARFRRERDPLKPRKTKPASLTKIFRTIWPTLTCMERFILLFGFFAAIVVAAATPAFAIVLAKLLNVFYSKENQTSQARKWALSLLAIAVIDGCAAFCTHYALEYSGQAWINSLRVEALKRILNQPKSWFDREQNSSSRLNECLDRNAEEMRNLVGRFAGLLFTALWMLAFSIVWAFTISWKLTLVALACAPVMYAITRAFHLMSSTWEDKCNKSSDVTSSIFTETFSNIRVVRAFTLENYFNRKHSKAAGDTYRIGLCRAAHTGLLFGLTDSVSFFITALIFYYGAKIISSGQGSVNSIIEVMNLLLFGIANATNLLSMVPQISSSRTTATQMLYLANLPLRASHKAQGTTRIPTPFPVKLTNLSFTYPSKVPRTKTLSNIDLTISPGSCTAIVGPSGSGKSTLASILLGLYPPDASGPGSPAPLTFADTSISHLNLHTLRHHISIVPQTPLIFPSSILSNITYGLSESSPYNNLSSTISAARDSGIHDFIMSRENGYSTLIGDGGMGLSGGQAQRIAIARALVRRPKVLVLDEATSALDGVSAEGIRETIRRVTNRGRSSSRSGSGGSGEGMAVVIVSHNVEMMRVADVIVVIEEGRVVERGPFEELKRKGGPFARLIGVGRERGVSAMGVPRLMTPVKGRSKDSWIRKTSV